MEHSTSSATSTPMRVLVVDDHPGTAETLVRAIARISPNLEVQSASDGESALKQYNGEPIDIIITDMMMPRMDGIELIEQLRKRNGGNALYSILITAYDVPGLKETARRMKVDQVLIKPFPPERICQIVSRALERTRPAKPDIDPPNKLPVHRLLIADDNPGNIFLLRRYLQEDEYEIVTAANGQETLQILRSAPFDLVLLDVNMPEMDGFQVLEQIRNDPNLAHIPVVIITAARLDPVDMQYALNLGADDYIVKPFDRRELMGRIHTRLRVKEMEDALRRRNRELSLVPEIGQMLSGDFQLPVSVPLILRRIVETLAALWGALSMTDAQGNLGRETYFFDGEQNIQPAQMDWNAFLPQIHENRRGWVLKVKHGDLPWSGSARSLAVVPLFSGANLLGLLLLASKQPDAFSEEHLSLLQVIAWQIAMAVEHARFSGLLNKSAS